MLDPHQHFLGLEPDATPATLLGLAPDELRDPVRIESALRRRLAEVYQHPDHSSANMTPVLRSLREAAETLKRQVGTLGPVRRPAPWRLTEFDRNVLAILVGYGGWNAQSRARLVGLATSQGVTVGGLMKVIEGLGEYAKAGGPALSVSEMRPTITPSAGPRTWAVSDALLDKLLPELVEPDTRTTIKLSALFGLMTLLVGVIALRFLLPTPPPPDSDMNNGMAGVIQAPTITPPRAGYSDDAQQQMRIPDLFDDRPTFAGATQPSEAIVARNSLEEMLKLLDRESRRFSVSDDPPQIAFRNWGEALEVIANAWMLLDRVSHDTAILAVTDTLFAASHTPSVTDRLLESFNPPSRLMYPSELWSGAWRAGMLGHISESDMLPPAVRVRAQDQLQVILAGQSHRARTRGNAFTVASGAWLEVAQEQLVSAVEYDQRSYDYWELWIRVQRRLGDASRQDRAFIGAARALLRHHGNISNSGHAVNVLGRLLDEVDLESSAEVRNGILAMYQDEHINSDGLWAMTSILAFDEVAPWYDQSLIVPPDASMNVRRRYQQDVATIWPAVHVPKHDALAVAMNIDPELIESWSGIVDLLAMDNLAPDDFTRMNRLLLAARVNQAAMFLATDHPQRASRLLRELERELNESGYRTSGSQRAATQQLPNDGDWASRYEEVRRNTEEKLTLLERLRTSRVTDLGPVDAAVLVREVYRGSPVEVRVAAQAALQSRFVSSLNVTRELLDQLPDAARSQTNADVITQFTGERLPGVSQGQWMSAARRALLAHALALHNSIAAEIDRIADDLAECYAIQAAAANDANLDSIRAMRPDEAGQHLLDAWRLTAATAASAYGVSYNESGKLGRQGVREQLAQGVIQRFLARQLSILDELVFITLAEQPHLRSTVNEAVQSSAQQRMNLRHVLDQSIEAELLMNQLWRIRLTTEASEPQSEEVS